MTDMAQGLVTNTTPVQLIVEKERTTIKLREKTIKWDNRLLDENQSKVLLEFIEFVYKAGFSDAAALALNSTKNNDPSEQRQDRIAEIISEALNNKE